MSSRDTSEDPAENPSPHRLRACACGQRRSHAGSRPRNRTGAPGCALGVGAVRAGRPIALPQRDGWLAEASARGKFPLEMAKQIRHSMDQPHVPPRGLPALSLPQHLRSPAIPHHLGWLNDWSAAAAQAIGFPDPARDVEMLSRARRTATGGWGVRLTDRVALRPEPELSDARLAVRAAGLLDRWSARAARRTCEAPLCAQAGMTGPHFGGLRRAANRWARPQSPTSRSACPSWAGGCRWCSRAGRASPRCHGRWRRSSARAPHAAPGSPGTRTGAGARSS